MAHNVSAKPDARREARVPKAKAQSAAAGFACYTPLGLGDGSELDRSELTKRPLQEFDPIPQGIEDVDTLKSLKRQISVHRIPLLFTACDQLFQVTH